jgi:hypothetical protein
MQSVFKIVEPEKRHLWNSKGTAEGFVDSWGCRVGEYMNMKIAVLVSLSVVALVLTVLGILWSNREQIKPDPDDNDILHVVVEDSPWKKHRGPAFGAAGALLGFAATLIALFSSN